VGGATDDKARLKQLEKENRELRQANETYHLHKAREAAPETRPARWHRDEALSATIERVWRENKSVYGAARSGSSFTAKVSRRRAARSSG
jgi:hypothetical protein